MKKLKGKLWNVLITALLCLMAMVLSTSSIPVHEEVEKVVALTYDDGPSPISTAQLLEILDQHEAHATFFLNGNHALDYKELVWQISEQGSEIGNHTMDHVWLTKTDPQEAQMQVIGNEHLLRFLSEQEGVMPLRPPYGDVNQEVMDRFDMPIVMWSVDSRDWEVQNVEKIKANVLAEVQDGSIIIMHDGYETTVQATKELLEIFDDQHIRVVSVGELFAMKGIEMPLHTKIKSIHSAP